MKQGGKTPLTPGTHAPEASLIEAEVEITARLHRAPLPVVFRVFSIWTPPSSLSAFSLHWSEDMAYSLASLRIVVPSVSSFSPEKIAGVVTRVVLPSLRKLFWQYGLTVSLEVREVILNPLRQLERPKSGS